MNVVQVPVQVLAAIRVELFRMNLDSHSGTADCDAAARGARRHAEMRPQTHSHVLCARTAGHAQNASASIAAIPSNALKEQISKSAARDKYERILHRASSMEVGATLLAVQSMRLCVLCFFSGKYCGKTEAIRRLWKT
jgi:hypothetical protein